MKYLILLVLAMFIAGGCWSQFRPKYIGDTYALPVSRDTIFIPDSCGINFIATGHKVYFIESVSREIEEPITIKGLIKQLRRGGGVITFECPFTPTEIREILTYFEDKEYGQISTPLK